MCLGATQESWYKQLVTILIREWGGATPVTLAKTYLAQG
ncbi:hypothetical protein IGI49_004999 [Enterococcus sp. AZ071]